MDRRASGAVSKWARGSELKNTMRRMDPDKKSWLDQRRERRAIIAYNRWRHEEWRSFHAMKHALVKLLKQDQTRPKCA